jgi:tetratricopeptide (TPR) repeat protein
MITSKMKWKRYLCPSKGDLAVCLAFFLPFPFYFLSTPSFSQTAEQTLAFAQWNYSQNNFAESAASCKRIIYFDSTRNIRSSAYLQLANSLLKQNQLDSAIENFSKVRLYAAPQDSIELEAEFGKIACHILLNDPHYAMMSLMDMRSEMPVFFQRKKIFYKAVLYFKINNYASSERGFIELLQNNDSVYVKEIFKHLNETFRKVNPHKAKVLSMILPGAGQLYLKDYKNAANSFLLNAAIITAGVHFASVYTAVDAYLFTANWFWRYYKGGFLKTKLNAEAQLANAKNSSLRQLMDLTEKNVLK